MSALNFLFGSFPLFICLCPILVYFFSFYLVLFITIVDAFLYINKGEEKKGVYLGKWENAENLRKPWSDYIVLKIGFIKN